MHQTKQTAKKLSTMGYDFHSVFISTFVVVVVVVVVVVEKSK